jgi:lysophospholipase L1-like esterase
MNIFKKLLPYMLLKRILFFMLASLILATSNLGTVYAATDICDEGYLRNIGAATISCIEENECADESEIVALSGDDNIAKIFNYFLPKGYKDFQIAGMLGNMQSESGIQPQRLQGTASGTVTLAANVPRNQAAKAYGLVQWDRAHKMIDPVTAAGNDPNTIEAQLDFLWEQLEGRTPSPEKRAGDHLKATTDVASATLSFETKYERHAGAPQPVRITQAEKILNDARAKNLTTAAAATGTTPAAPGSPAAAGANTKISKVYILGDSITVGAEATYKTALGTSGITPTISAVTSRSWNGAGSPSLGSAGTTGAGKAAALADQAAVKEAGAIVVALGTNGGLGSNPVDEVLSTFKGLNAAAPIYWVNIASSVSDVVPLVAPFNNKLKEQQTAGALTMIDWAQIVNPGGNGTQDSAGLLRDGIHPKPDSYPKLVDAVVRAVSSGAGSIGSSTCGPGSNQVAGEGFAAKVTAYAWPDYKPKPFLERMPAYTAAIEKAKSEGRYIGGSDGIDCGGFITTLMIDSGFDPTYNSNGKGGATPIQKQWLDANWQNLGPITDTSQLQPGDVAMQPSHTFVFVGDIPGFNSKMASASLGQRAPMADKYGMSGDGIVWYRKK